MTVAATAISFLIVDVEDVSERRVRSATKQVASLALCLWWPAVNTARILKC